MEKFQLSEGSTATENGLSLEASEDLPVSFIYIENVIRNDFGKLTIDPKNKKTLKP